eukprot:CAMPEP_0201600764 /NCGR_PEP_ID=MMETSP0492-20130828/1780_1 /ASSEMBLY_ACC=CAM_ASM_000837 /TAXON_ID=420259 /ORGANISM="Thalassiosira gravida, Strain GMp14c1" /LENGTH=86 /DNA_ID=CAMNT_0048063659 /DNA_START=170 /DNA_END=430 /DNA_ORIENTATION=+
MSEVPGTDRGETFIHRLMTGHSERVSNSLNDDDGENDMVDDDASAFSSQSIDESTEDDISPRISARPNDDPVNNTSSNQTRLGVCL